MVVDSLLQVLEDENILEERMKELVRTCVETSFLSSRRELHVRTRELRDHDTISCLDLTDNRL